MQVTDILRQTGGFESIARELGVSETDAASGAQALLPAVLGGFKKQAQTQSGGIEGLGGLLGRLGGGALLDEVVSPQPTDVSRGNDVLGQIFGSKEVSRAVAQDAASRSGLAPGVLKKMLPMLAMLVAGYMAKQRGPDSGGASPSGGGMGDLLGKAIGGQGRRPGLGGLASMLDLDRDGNPLDDILNMVRRRG